MLIRIEGYKNLQVHENVDCIIGEDCHFNGMAIQNDGAHKGLPKATVRIGSHFHSGKGCMIRTSDHNFASGYPMISASISGYVTRDVSIGEYVWLGDGVLVMKGVSIGDGAVIQAKSVVVSDIPALAIAGGHPCRTFAYRDAGEFEFLKSLNISGRIPGGAPAVQERRLFVEQELEKMRVARKSERHP